MVVLKKSAQFWLIVNLRDLGINKFLLKVDFSKSFYLLIYLSVQTYSIKSRYLVGGARFDEVFFKDVVECRIQIFPYILN